MKRKLSPALQFLQSTQGASSMPKPIDLCVIQGSCLGRTIPQRYGMIICGYDDDHGIFDSFIPSNEEIVVDLLWIDAKYVWIQSMSGWILTGWKWFPKKPDYFGSTPQLLKCQKDSLNVCNTLVTRTDKMKYLGVWMDENLTYKYQKAKRAVFNLANIRSIWNYLIWLIWSGVNWTLPIFYILVWHTVIYHDCSEFKTQPPNWCLNTTVIRAQLRL